MASNYQSMLKDAQGRLTLVDKERTALLGLIDSLTELISIEKDQPAHHVKPGDVLPEPDRPPQAKLLDIAVGILRKRGSSIRGIDLQKAINAQTGRSYDYSSISKALSRDAESSGGGVVVKNDDRTWGLREWEPAK